ncbi:MAG: ChaN family lipoprotein [Nitrospiraceae bacterium]|nr:ChaN family lipoprotein [Nitrospiraceae bacterium]
MKKLAILFSTISMFLSFTASAYASTDIPQCLVSVVIDPAASAVSGVMESRADAASELRLIVADLSVRKVLVDDKEVVFGIDKGILKVAGPVRGIVRVYYSGVFMPKDYHINGSSIGKEGIFLSGVWHPRPESSCVYRLKAVLPAGYIAVSEAEHISRTEKPGNVEYGFEFNHKLEGLTLVASSRFSVLKDAVGDTELYAYFFKEDEGLAKDYLQKVKQYISMYEKLIGKFPYKRFSVVENFLPTGYAMPTYTLLGRDVVRLPFIINTSLGHEVLHQWFGNYVQPDYDKGNWSEGLATYLADHLYEEQAGKGSEYRKGMLTDIRSYDPEGKAGTVRQFRYAQDRASRAAGYSRAAMIFHMLRKELGDDKFYSALRNFISANRDKKASWEDIRSAFEKAASKDMSVFFSQWLDAKALPVFSFGNPVVRYIKGQYNIEFDLVQTGRPFRLRLPVAFHTSSGVKRHTFRVNGKITRIGITLDQIPDRIVVDDSYDLLRALSADETPPLLSAYLGAKKVIVALPQKNIEAYNDVVDYYKNAGAVVKPASDISGNDLVSGSVVVLDSSNRYASMFNSKEAQAGFYVKAIKNPYNNSDVMVYINAVKRQEAEAAFRKIQHYGKYSELAFSAGKNILKTTTAAVNGIELMIKSDKNAVPLASVTSIRDMAIQSKDKKIIYVGEEHNNFSHHLAQLDVIRTLHEQGKKVAIGMEMFYRSSQAALDGYTSGAIDEREFLKRSGYFRQWGFDYSLYKPILDFARLNKLPVVALNITRKIVGKVGESGISSLTEEEKAQLPKQMDYSDEDYRARLVAVLETHSGAGRRNFENFFQAQVLWDEYMAESVDIFMKKNPERTMVVVAGGGHLSYGSGIPKRAYRRNSLPYAIILNGDNMAPGIADYIVMPDSAEYQKSPRMMVILKETDKGLVITGFPEGSSAQEAGLEEGDLILEAGGRAVKDMEGLRIELFFRSAGEKITISVLRKRFLFGDARKEFEVLLR